MKNGSTPLRSFGTMSGGISGGGVTSSIRIADDGRMVNRNDTDTCYFKEPNSDRWISAYRPGENTAASEIVWGDYATVFCYDIDICASNSNIGWLIKHGRLYKTTNFFGLLVRSTAYKSGAYDVNLTHRPHHAARSGGSYLRIDPVNPLRVALGHPTEPAQITLDGGATPFTQVASLPAPINETGKRSGCHWAFDRSTASGGSCQTVYELIAGRGVYRSTTGLAGPYTFIGGPLLCTALEANGGRLYVTGDPDAANGQVWVWNGTTWAQPSGQVARTICSDPANALNVASLTEGGNMGYSSDGGVTWANYDIDGVVDADADSPWLGKTLIEYLGACTMVWERRTGVNRLVISTGIGVITFDNPPRTLLSQKYKAMSKGIKQMLLKNAVVTKRGDLLVVGEDRPIFRVPAGKWADEQADHGPNYDWALRHGGDIDYAPEDESYCVSVYGHGGPIGTPQFAVSTNGGKTWVEPPARPVWSGGGETNFPMFAGNVAVTGVGKIIWASSLGGGMLYSEDGGATWALPVFRLTPGGTTVDMVGASWHQDFTFRRKALVSDKSLGGHAVAFCNGFRRNDLNNVVADLVGQWETFDHGKTWVRIRSTNRLGGIFHTKQRFVPGSSTDMFYCAGANPGAKDANGWDTVSNDSGLYFSTDKGVNEVVITGFRECQDFTFSRKPGGGIRVNVFGWRDLSGTLTLGLWGCDNFDRLNPNAGTWTFLCGPPDARYDPNYTLAGNPAVSAVALIPSSGGFHVYDELSTARAGKPYAMLAT